ncbi:MAG: hypothetical protein ACOX8E_12725 [Ruminococcus sp.]|jgi:hypothetical protein
MQDFKYKVKKAARCCVFFLILIAVLMGMSIQLTKLSRENDELIQSRDKSLIKIQKEPENTVDVLMLGDSLCYTAFSPMQLWDQNGITSYIGGQSGQKINETYYMLKTALETQSPRLVVIEADVLLRGQYGLTGLKEIIREKGSHYFPVFRYHNVWKPLLMGTEYAEESYKGFMIRDTIAPYIGGEYMKATDKQIKLSDFVTEYMNRIIQLCEEEEINLLLVSTPSPANYNYKKYNALKTYAKEHSLPYLDMNLKVKKLGLNWKADSLDKGDHVNLMGAVKITRYLAEYLEKHYDLPDHRGDKAYEAWERESREYKVKVKRKLEFMEKSLRSI